MIREKHFSFFYAAALLLFITAFFGKTVLFGMPISKLHLISQIDSLFNPALKSTELRSWYDPSVYFLSVPYGMLVEQIWRSGHIPLWNPYNGCGTTIIGDVLFFVFSPFAKIFSPSSVYLYNLGIAAKDAGCALGTFLLARQLGLSRPAAAFSALAFALCPFTLRELEMSFETWLVPWLALVILRFAPRADAGSAIKLGLCSALLILMIHPEFAFMGIAIGLLLSASLVVPSPAGGPGARGLLKTLCLGGIISFCLAAPSLIPFAEFMKYGECYKSGKFGVETIPWNTIVYNLANPGFSGDSPFLGLPAALLLLLSLFSGKRLSRFLFLIALAVFCLSSLPGPFAHSCLAQHPFSFLPARYWLGPLLMLISLLAGFGLEEAVERTKFGLNKRSFVLLGSAAFLAILPASAGALGKHFVSWNFDGGIIPFAPCHSAAARDAVIIAVCLAIFALRDRLPFKRHWLYALMICLSLASEATVSRSTLPRQQAFRYQLIEPIPWLQKKGERIAALGRHFFLPNISIAYGIKDLRMYDAIRPPRYWEFMKLAFVQSQAEDTVGQAIDLASVKYLISRAPVRLSDDCRDDLLPVASVREGSAVIVPGLSLTSAALGCRQANSEILGRIGWQAVPGVSKDYSCQFVLLDSNGKELWSSDQFFIDSGKRCRNAVSQDLAIAIPADLPAGSTVSAGMRILWSWSGAWIWPQACRLPLKGQTIILKDFVINKPAATRQNSPLRLVYTASGIRVYENSRALPQAYIVHEALAGKDANQAARLIASPDFRPREEAVLEGCPDNLNLAPAGKEETVKLARPDLETVDLDVESAGRGILVLTDTFYPGWHARIDGNEAPIYRANFYFRAVVVPKGRHHVVFHYMPASFLLGLALAALCAAGLLAAALRRSFLRTS